MVYGISGNFFEVISYDVSFDDTYFIPSEFHYKEQHSINSLPG